MSLYIALIIKAYRVVGATFDGRPEYIDNHSFIDVSGGVTIGEGAVISTNVVILSHDWSFLKKMKAKEESFDEDMGKRAFLPVYIGKESFIGAGAIILPGTRIGNYCIVGAGSVVKGVFEDYSVIVGSPARRIKDIRD